MLGRFAFESVQVVHRSGVEAKSGSDKRACNVLRLSTGRRRVGNTLAERLVGRSGLVTGNLHTTGDGVVSMSCMLGRVRLGDGASGREQESSGETDGEDHVFQKSRGEEKREEGV